MQTTIPNEDFDPRLRMTGDETLLVKFEIKPKLHTGMSEKEGRPVYKDVEYISIRAPGAPDEICRPATQRDIDRFPKHYQAFKNRVENQDTIEGTLLTEWPAVTRSQAEELAFFGVKTVEQLAAMSDANGQQMMGFHGLKRKANEWLEQANAGVKAQELQTELEKRDEQIAQLKAQLDELQAAKPRGRPRKKATTKKAGEPATQKE